MMHIVNQVLQLLQIRKSCTHIVHQVLQLLQIRQYFTIPLIYSKTYDITIAKIVFFRRSNT